MRAAGRRRTSLALRWRSATSRVRTRSKPSSAAARLAGAPVNIVDKPDFCDFSFGTLVNRSPLIVAISTDGAAPVFGQAIRTRIETLLPETLKAWARAAKDWRPAVQARELPFALRRAFWELFTARAMSESGRLPEEADRAELFASLERIEGCAGSRPGLAGRRRPRRSGTPDAEGDPRPAERRHHPL